jgi:hypothetical protein
MQKTSIIANLVLAYEFASVQLKQLPTLVRWTGVVLLKSLAVSIVLGWVSTYATAYYAVKAGFRVPIEGVPYISFAISLWSLFAFILSIALVTAAVSMFIFLTKLSDRLIMEIQRRIIKYMPARIDEKNVKYKNRKRIIRVLMTKSLPFLVAGTFILTISIYFFADVNKESPFIPQVFGMPDKYVLLSLCCLTFLATFARWFSENKYEYWKMQAFLSIPVIIVMVISLFTADFYGSLLRIIRYGGGIRILIRYTENTNLPGEGFLLLQNDHQLILFGLDSLIYEIPVGFVRSKAFDVKPDWKVPPNDLRDQTRYIDIKK